MSVSAPVKEDIIQQQILEAAKRLFAVHGFSKVTMDDVAKAIGKGRSSLYYYYKSKDEIFDAVMDIEIREMLTAISRAVDQAPDTEQKLHAFCATKLHVLREKRPFFKTLDAGMDADALSQFNKMQVVHHHQIIQKESAVLAQLLSDGMEKGELRKLPKKEMDMFIFVVLGSLHGLKREMILENNFEKIEPAVNAFTDMLMRGLKN
jgi:AcrR family transcriptional regulator